LPAPTRAVHEPTHEVDAMSEGSADALEFYQEARR
jgi:hypothetical protein